MSLLLMIVFSYVLPELFHTANPLLFSMFPKTTHGTETGTCTPELSLRRLTLVDIPLPDLALGDACLVGIFTFLGRFVIIMIRTVGWLTRTSHNGIAWSVPNSVMMHELFCITCQWTLVKHHTISSCYWPPRFARKILAPPT